MSISALEQDEILEGDNLEIIDILKNKLKGGNLTEIEEKAIDREIETRESCEKFLLDVQEMHAEHVEELKLLQGHEHFGQDTYRNSAHSITGNLKAKIQKPGVNAVETELGITYQKFAQIMREGPIVSRKPKEI